MLVFFFVLVKVFMVEKIFIGESGDVNDMWVNIFKVFGLNFYDFFFNMYNRFI